MREALQRELIAELKPDVCFLQEVNPVADRVRHLSQDLQLESVYQPDLVGLKLFGVGLPLNLNSGLMIGVSKRWGVKPLDAISLSRPHFNWVRKWASWQLKEERFALFAETILPQWGKVLLVNTHLHHGLEVTPELLADLDKMAQELELTTATVSELKDRLNAGNARRAQELEVLLKAIEKHEKRYAAVLLCGDFNATPESELYKTLRERGFRDSWAELHPPNEGFTFDATKNQANHRLQAEFPLSLVVEDLSFSSKVKEAFLKLGRCQENRPRRIDYVFFKSVGADLKPSRVELVGFPNAEGLAPSDHFGILADIEVNS